MKRILIALALVLLVTAAAQAESQIGGKAGQWYLGLNLNSGEQLNDDISIGFAPFGFSVGRTTQDGGTTEGWLTINGSGEVGYFIIDGLQIGFVLFFNYSMEFGSTDPFLMLGPGLEIGYIFDLGGFISPFVQVNASFLYFSWGATSSFMGFKVMPIAGVKLYANKTVAFDIGAFFNYSMLSESNTSTPDSWNNMYAGLRIGVSLFL